MAPSSVGGSKDLGVRSGDVVEIVNDYGSTFAMAYLEPDIKRQRCFMMFGYDNGVMGDVTTPWTDENVVPYYKKERGQIFLLSAVWNTISARSVSSAADIDSEQMVKQCCGSFAGFGSALLC